MQEFPLPIIIFEAIFGNYGVLLLVEPTVNAEAKERIGEALPVSKANPRLACCEHLVARPVPYAWAKRLFDIVFSLFLLLIFAPLFVILALIVKLTSSGPVFYKSTRIGICGEKFAFIKFRSMRTDADKMLAQLQSANEKDGPIFKMKNDPRITSVGAFLRKYSLDELPQLMSVLTGEMSMVGPRPPLPSEVEQYDELTMQRLTVKPGITCYWQIMGRSSLTFDQWMELDRRYIKEMSFWKDLAIVAKTPLSVIRGDGAY